MRSNVRCLSIVFLPRSDTSCVCIIFLTLYRTSSPTMEISTALPDLCSATVQFCHSDFALRSLVDQKSEVIITRIFVKPDQKPRSNRGNLLEKVPPGPRRNDLVVSPCSLAYDAALSDNHHQFASEKPRKLAITCNSSIDILIPSNNRCALIAIYDPNARNL